VLDALVGANSSAATKDSFRKKLRAGELNDKEIEIETQSSGGGMPMFEIPGMPGAQMGAISIGDIFGKLGGGRTKTRRLTVKDSHEILINEESDKLLDSDSWCRKRSRRSRITASCFSTRSTRSACATAAAAATCRARACSATCCR
jgi:ATP-dependent protease HslVU (ClpYQ) ATPase subunit